MLDHGCRHAIGDFSDVIVMACAAIVPGRVGPVAMGAGVLSDGLEIADMTISGGAGKLNRDVFRALYGVAGHASFFPG